MNNGIKPSFSTVTIADYDEAMRRLFRAETERDEAQDKVRVAQDECDRIRRQLFGCEPAQAESPSSLVELPMGSSDGSSHMPKILAFLASQPGRTAKANAIVAALGVEKESSIRSALVRMVKPKDGRLVSPKRGYYRLA